MDISEIVSKSLLANNNYKIYCDLDGVLTDFDNQAISIRKDIFKFYHEEPSVFWSLINKKGVEFWSTMPWERHGKKLWNFIKKYNPIILTAHPVNKELATRGKSIWINENLGNKFVKTALIVRKKDKALYANENSILIDDDELNIERWRKANGIGILHTNTVNTIKHLKKYLV